MNSSQELFNEVFNQLNCSDFDVHSKRFTEKKVKEIERRFNLLLEYLKKVEIK